MFDRQTIFAYLDMPKARHAAQTLLGFSQVRAKTDRVAR